jgi:F-type H+-transporting ATPase subunit b
MKNSDVNRKQGYQKILLAIVLSLMLMLWCGPVLAEGDGGGHGETPPAKGWVKTDTWRVLNFGILAVGLFLLLRKPVAQALTARIDGIKEQLGELETKKEEAEKELAAYGEKLALLEKEAENIVEGYIKQGNEAKKRILKEAELTAEKLEEKARRNIDHEFKQAKAQLQSEIIEQALEKAEKKIIEKISSDDQDRLVDEYLEKVVA